MKPVLATDKKRIERWIKHPISVRLSINWPLLHEIFRKDLGDRITGVLQEKHQSFTSPWKVQFPAHKSYYYPGSVEDYIFFVQAVLQCRSAIAYTKKCNSDPSDFGPPHTIEIEQGEPGNARFLGQYLLHFSRYVKQHSLPNGVIVHADVRGFFSSIDPEILATQLLEQQVPKDSVYQLFQLLNFFKTRDCHGLPFLYASWPLANMYLSIVDAKLRNSGIRAARLGDDFRLICPNADDAKASLQVLNQALGKLGLSIAPEKTWFEQVGSRVDNNERNRRTRQGILKHGHVQPLLAQSLHYRFFQPISIALLRKFRFPCYPAHQLK